jgi:hypothetical protein
MQQQQACRAEAVALKGAQCVAVCPELKMLLSLCQLMKPLLALLRTGFLILH